MYATRSICVWELSDLDGRGECALQKLVASILAIASLVVVACKPEAAQTEGRGSHAVKWLKRLHDEMEV